MQSVRKRAKRHHLGIFCPLPSCYLFPFSSGTEPQRYSTLGPSQVRAAHNTAGLALATVSCSSISWPSYLLATRVCSCSTLCCMSRFLLLNWMVLVETRQLPVERDGALVSPKTPINENRILLIECNARCVGCQKPNLYQGGPNSLQPSEADFCHCEAAVVCAGSQG